MVGAMSFAVVEEREWDVAKTRSKAARAESLRDGGIRVNSFKASGKARDDSTSQVKGTRSGRLY